MEEENKALVEISKAQQALDKANNIHEIIDLRDKAMAMQIFANAQGFEEAAQKAKIYQLKAERKAGQWLRDNVRHRGGIESNEYQDGTHLPEGIDKHESQRWQLEAKLSEEKFNDWIDECITKDKEITASKLQFMATGIHVSDDSYEWFTPKEYIDAARKLMGSIDLDPASCEEAQTIIQAGKYYTKEDNGLIQPWFGNVWINPPYNMPLIEQFSNKVIQEYKDNNINSAVILTNNATDTNWFHSLLEYPVCLTKGRIQFWSTNNTVSQPRCGQSLFYLGKDIIKFTNIFNNFGVVVSKL
jgi:phage N-6-adenine-methyltransferase